jgi:large subunit ribosomal protein L29
MKIYEIRQLSDTEIQKRIEEEQSILLDLRFSHSLKQLVNSAKIKGSKKTIARLKTVLAERETGASAQEGVQSK